MSWRARAQWRLSRGFNVLMFGSYKEMFCSRAHRLRWRFAIWFIDQALYPLHRHENHCAACWRWDSVHGTYKAAG